MCVCVCVCTRVCVSAAYNRIYSVFCVKWFSEMHFLWPSYYLEQGTNADCTASVYILMSILKYLCNIILI